MTRGRDRSRGCLLVFEGIDGAGKSTQIRLLAGHLTERGHEVLVTREPTSGPFGTRIRESAAQGVQVPAEQELDWFVRDRRDHVEHTIEPALSAGKVVISDRYYLSTVAYQGARGIPYEQILDDSEAKFPHPDLAFWLDVEPSLGLCRVKARGSGVDLVFEQLERLKAATRIFGLIDRPYLCRIDGSADVETVSLAIRAALSTALPNLG